MSVVPFETLPDSARVWVFGSDRALSEPAAGAVLSGVDAHLANWKAHGEPLTVARDWRDARFLVVAVDQSTVGASGCSIDGLFRVLQELEQSVGASLVGGGRVFYRDGTGTVQSASRAEVATLVGNGAITPDTVVFDMGLTDLGSWRTCFERPAKESWVKDLLA